MKKLRVLVVEDERVARMVATRVLGASSFEVIAAVESGEAALKYLGLTAETENVKVDVDLILSDHDMPPGISGYELLLELKNSKLSNVPVAIISADADEDRVKKCMDGGALMFLKKPLQRKDADNLYGACS